ncbi:hypothetical protein P5673_007875 [Acropora cervicornis]|uniref:Uncharacterized protein n=1 Tax=Acropora cervicornis TaxID=6130 RepID=A0AAD9QV61_ACRCE|nr:hypothetical protein P5673_007875 [Acropora cervicornis]
MKSYMKFRLITFSLFFYIKTNAFFLVCSDTATYVPFCPWLFVCIEIQIRIRQTLELSRIMLKSIRKRFKFGDSKCRFEDKRMVLDFLFHPHKMQIQRNDLSDF